MYVISMSANRRANQKGVTPRMTSPTGILAMPAMTKRLRPIGGVSVGEDRDSVRLAVASTAGRLPPDRPRYLMGVGTPRDFLEAIEQGVDLFDCVTPTRHGRTHQVFTSTGTLNLRNASHARDTRPIEEGCDCAACGSFSRGYLRHLANSNEMLAAILLTLHNLRFFQRLLEEARKAIAEETFPLLRGRYGPSPV